jgi:integrase
MNHGITDGNIRDFSGQTPVPNLTHTKVLSAEFNRVKFARAETTWNSLLNETIRFAKKTAKSDDEFKRLVTVNWVKGKKEDGGYRYLPDVNVSVRLGVPIESLTSLAALLHPDVIEPVIDAYWRKNGDEPKTSTIDLGWKALRIARETSCLDQAALERLDDIRVTLEHHRRAGLTPKNLHLVRQVLTEGVWNSVVSLPNVLMKQARADYDHAPIKAGITAQLAVAIAILTFAPIRLSNLVGIELDKNLIKPGGLNKPYWLVFPHYDVKNRVDLNFQFDQPLTDLIDEYVHEYRPALLRGSNSSWLFPGEGGGPKTAITFSGLITKRIVKAVGARITVHQFRHAAAAIYLKHRPGDYETVRRLLGHRSIETTINFYCGLQTTQATEQFGKLIRQQIKFDATV